MAHVLIIEDDSMIAAIERDFLEANGFEVSVAMTGKEGLKIFDGGAIEAVLLDIGLPDTDGFLLCRKLRDISNVPILFITARGSDDDKIKGLGLGADDYIVKPFNPSEMMARLKAHLEIHQRLLGVRSRMPMTTNRISKSATCAFSSSATRFSGEKQKSI